MRQVDSWITFCVFFCVFQLSHASESVQPPESFVIGDGVWTKASFTGGCFYGASGFTEHPNDYVRASDGTPTENEKLVFVMVDLFNARNDPDASQILFHEAFTDAVSDPSLITYSRAQYLKPWSQNINFDFLTYQTQADCTQTRLVETSPGTFQKKSGTWLSTGIVYYKETFPYKFTHRCPLDHILYIGGDVSNIEDSAEYNTNNMQKMYYSFDEAVAACMRICQSEASCSWMSVVEKEGADYYECRTDSGPAQDSGPVIPQRCDSPQSPSYLSSVDRRRFVAFVQYEDVEVSHALTFSTRFTHVCPQGDDLIIDESSTNGLATDLSDVTSIASDSTANTYVYTYEAAFDQCRSICASEATCNFFGLNVKSGAYDCYTDRTGFKQYLEYTCNRGKSSQITWEFDASYVNDVGDAVKGATVLKQSMCQIGHEFDGSVCTACAAGTSTAGLGFDACSPCPVGNEAAAGDACQACPAGKFSSATGTSACSECGPGKYSSAEGASACTACVPGKIS